MLKTPIGLPRDDVRHGSFGPCQGVPQLTTNSISHATGPHVDPHQSESEDNRF
jgi:hypothetical protein